VFVHRQQLAHNEQCVGGANRLATFHAVRRDELNDLRTESRALRQKLSCLRDHGIDERQGHALDLLLWISIYQPLQITV
jgi:hypothetical protein